MEELHSVQKVLGLESYSIEIDDMLVELQHHLTTTLDFHPFCSDATSFDYSSLNLTSPIFFIGGLAQMGGTELASGVLGKINLNSNLGAILIGPLLELILQNTLQIQKTRLAGVL